jgi:hypothetical protein
MLVKLAPDGDDLLHQRIGQDIGYLLFKVHKGVMELKIETQ